jgi:hypothetical protein
MVDLKEIFSYINAIYSSFVLRDFLGKIIPGSVFLITGILYTIDISYIGKSFQYLENFWIWIIFIGISWLTGLAIQGLGTRTGLISPFPKDEANQKDGEVKYQSFAEKSNSVEFKIHERYVVLREACGNGYVSLLFSLFFLIPNIVIKFFFHGTYENVFLFYLDNNLPGVVTLLILYVFVIIGLYIMHAQSKRNQWTYMESVLKKY